MTEGKLDLTEKLELLPDLPGVYLFKDFSGQVIYVGKASSLRKRVRSYFQDRPRWIKESFLIRELVDFDYIVTSTEVEALVLEGNLIKKHKPKYNIVLKDDKNYPMIRVGIGERFPSLRVVRRPADDGALYFGPFVSSQALRMLLDELRKAFGVRSCSDTVFERRKRPCILYQLGRCLAPCSGSVDEDSYRKRVEEMVKVLRGDAEGILRSLKEEMEQAAKVLNFEKAALFRDRIRSIEKVLSFQVAYRPSKGDLDAVFYQRRGDTYFVCVVSVNEGKVVDKRGYKLDYPGDEGWFLHEFLLRFYEKGYLPREILLQREPEARGFLEEALEERAGRKVSLVVPKRGEKVRILRLAEENLLEILKLNIFGQKGEVLNFLKRVLHLRRIPMTIEAMDISHTGGSFVVGSVVVARDGELDKSSYRGYHLSPGPDDISSIRELVVRRYSKHPVPDLIVVDGGKGQLKAVMDALKEAGVGDMPDVVSIAKGRAKGVPDRVYIMGGRSFVVASPSKKGFRFLLKLRNEAHRFSNFVRYRWKKKEDLTSVLLAIKGIGPVTARRILDTFGSPWIFFEAVKRGEEVPLPAKVVEEVRRFVEGEGYSH